MNQPQKPRTPRKTKGKEDTWLIDVKPKPRDIVVGALVTVAGALFGEPAVSVLQGLLKLFGLS